MLVSRLGLSLLVNVWWKMLVLEASILTFGERLVENAGFGSLGSHFWWTSRGKRSFWKLGFSLLVKVSWKMVILEAWVLAFGERLVEKARFGSLDSPLENACFGSRSVKQECQERMSSKSVKQERRQRVSRKSVQQKCQRSASRRAKQECLARVSRRSAQQSVQEECLARVSCQERPSRVNKRLASDIYGKGVVRGSVECANLITNSQQQKRQARVTFQERPARVPSESVEQKCQARVSSKAGKQVCQERVWRKSVKKERQARVSRKPRGKCSFWKLWLSLLVNVPWKMLVLEAWIVTFGEGLLKNARFGSLDCHFWWKSPGNCSFWKLGVTL